LMPSSVRGATSVLYFWRVPFIFLGGADSVDR